jgi:molybdenum cofactor cytidylyltransferase
MARLGAIILAAGQSRRMGRNKLLMTMEDKPLLRHVVDAVAAAELPPPVIVLGHDAAAIRHALAGASVSYVMAKDHGLGMGHSIAAGIEAVPPDWDGAFICLGDMPFVSPELLRCMGEAFTGADVVVPVFEARRGNPLLWPRCQYAALAALTGDQGAKALITNGTIPVRDLPWHDDSIHRDIDVSGDMAD